MTRLAMMLSAVALLTGCAGRGGDLPLQSASALGRDRATPVDATYQLGVGDQIALTVCPSCDRGWHDAGGRAIAVPDSTIEQALCDAQYIGRTDLGVPLRADQEIPPAVARPVVRRARGGRRVRRRGRSRVPGGGCRPGRHPRHLPRGRRRSGEEATRRYQVASADPLVEETGVFLRTQFGSARLELILASRTGA